MEPCPAANRIELQEGADSRSNQRSLDEQNPVGLGQAGGTGDDDSRCDAADNHGDDVL